MAPPSGHDGLALSGVWFSEFIHRKQKWPENPAIAMSTDATSYIRPTAL
jgi:hypothetical protein